jgi:hypothetical protein
VTEETLQPNEAGQKAAEAALAEIHDRSYAGRHPELGRMINCALCGLRHRENWVRKCEQKFAEKDGVVYGELKPPEGLTHLTKNQIIGKARFKGRAVPRRRPKNPITKWERVLAEAQKRKEI